MGYHKVFLAILFFLFHPFIPCCY